ncbi:helicase [Rhizophlyctis rosea]|nr:helicase [Rhizophlyctis rosea]
MHKRFVPPKRKAPLTPTPPSVEIVTTATEIPSTNSTSQTSTFPTTIPPVKRRKLLHKPLLASGVATVSPATATPPAVETPGSPVVNWCYAVVWRKKQQKKHKTWDGDGILVIKGKVVTLFDIEGKEIAKSSTSLDELESGAELSVGSKEVEITGSVNWADYTSGKCFVGSATPMATNPSRSPAPVKLSKFKLTPVSGALASKSPAKVAVPRHNPLAPNALVMPRPDQTQKGVQYVDVVVDPVLSNHLRPHQREGVTFLYECIMGMKDHNGAGAILADEMGLGKTLQAISLIWTLLKQNPVANQSPVAKRGMQQALFVVTTLPNVGDAVLVVCPATLVANWKKEFKKWLGDERVKVFAVDQKSDIKDFMIGRVHQVIVIGYEKMRTCQELIQNSKIDLIVCDEGHRLKNSNIRTAQALMSLTTKRRIILSGTPIQNDLEEFRAMVDFRVFQDPIMRSRDPGCSAEEFQLGRERSEELSRLTRLFILRRTADINAKYLPPKQEVVIFVRPTAEQSRLYRELSESSALRSVLQKGPSASNILKYITTLKKLVNSPDLISGEDSSDAAENDELQSTVGASCERSGKLKLLMELLNEIKETTQEKVVVVSNWTQTLDVIQSICKEREYPHLRLDGSTPVSKRQEYVDQFNRATNSHFLFLLSSKAGGVGLNLIGASRLVLFDIDWNPALDQQAMARVWRDGQRKEVKIYRFLTTGTIEEKIYQRQITKIGLSDALMDDKDAAAINNFTAQELKDLFTLDERTSCSTHELLGCRCQAWD